jgi:hypothetical protein
VLVTFKTEGSGQLGKLLADISTFAYKTPFEGYTELVYYTEIKVCKGCEKGLVFLWHRAHSFEL